MKLHSFRLKLVLLSVGLSGLVLAAFGLSCWVLIYRSSLERLDREIRDWGHRDLERPTPPGRWARIAQAMRFALGGDPAGQRRFIMLVNDRNGGLTYKSPDWPAEISPADFPAPSGRMGPPAPGSGRPPPGRAADRSPAGAAMGEPPPPPDLGPGLDPDFDPDFGPGFDPGFGPGPPPPGDGPGFPDRFGERGPPAAPISPARFETRQVGRQRWRLGVMSSPDVTLVIGVDMDEFAAGMRRVGSAFLLALPAALLLIAAGSWLLAQRALRPVTGLTAAVERVTARGLDQRVAKQDADVEFRALIAVFNQMLARLERSFQQAVRFSADAAHELKTPLTVLQGRLEQALQRAAAGSEEQRVLGELAEEVQRLKTIVQRLLLLARADSGQLSPQVGSVDLTALVDSLGEDVGLMAPHLTVRRDLAPGVVVMADTDLLRQALHNLADNAVKYNREAGWIAFTLREAAGAAQLTVANTAVDIPHDDHERIFDRFYRADPARSRQVEGIGLGLSLAREIARAHHGELVLARSADGVTEFVLTLPLAPASPSPASSA
jgi:two-component system, OmpR family, heavy metal sensor histidine kinase CusS